MKRICAIGGDGIGPEMVEHALTTLEAMNIPIVIDHAEAGYSIYQKNGTSLPENTVETCRNADAILFGAVTTPPHIDNYKSPIVALRKQLDLFANVRPFTSLPIETTSHKNIDILLFRENTEGLYSGDESSDGETAITKRIITRKNSTRFVQTALRIAQEKKRKKITFVHKANVMRKTEGLFLEVAMHEAKSYTDFEIEYMLVDACAMQLVKKPQQFDVIITTNMFGDILSDLIAGLIGGLGVAASANIGANCGLFEPVHGSAPKYVGLNKANPIAMLLSVGYMLEYLDMIEEKNRLDNAIAMTLRHGLMTRDIGGSATTSDIIEFIQKNTCS